MMPSWATLFSHVDSLYGSACACNGRASGDVEAVVPAAYHGQVDRLFVAVGVQCWGTFDPTTHPVHWHSEAQTGDEDLLDVAAIHTLLNGGTVYAVAPEYVPDIRPLAAIFRY